MQNLSGKKKTIETYYDEEMWYLNEAGKEFEQAHPERARFLNITQLDDRDPYVERLFEGFAFLSGRIREKLDDELPELTQSLIGLLWPHYLRPIPSLSILEFEVIPDRIQNPHIIGHNTEVASQLVRGAHICNFRTCYDVHVRPIRLTEAVMEDNSTVRFRFELDEGVEYSNLFTMEGGSEYQRYCRRSIRLFIHDLGQRIATLLLSHLGWHVSEVIIQSGLKGAGPQVQGSIQPVGFDPEEGLLPYTDYSFSGYRLLQEYFAYPRKFLFFDIFGFDRLHPPDDARSFEVRILFDRPLSIERQFNRSNFRLHCTPIVNLAQVEALPITVDHESTEYKVKARSEGYEIYSVDEVEGIVSGTEERRTYIPFYSFRHGLPDGSGSQQPSSYYHTITRLATRRVGEGRTEDYQDTYIAVVNPDLEFDDLREETLSLTVACTNGVLARELKVGEIRNLTSNSQIPEFVRFANLTQPTLILYPPLQEGLEWRFISHLALNYLSLTSVDALRSILELYNWSKERGVREANNRRISSIINVRAEPGEIPYQGSVIRGMDVTLEVVRENFEDDGDIYLFGSMMKEFLGLYVSINSFVRLKIVSYQTKEELFEWVPEIMNDRNRESLMRRRHLPL